MEMNVIGTRGISFTSEIGKPIEGTTLYAAFEAEGVNGMMAEKFFVKKGVEMPEDLKMGDKIEVVFDYRRKIEYIERI